MAPNVSIDQHLRSDHSRIATDQYLDRYTTDIVFFDEIKKIIKKHVQQLCEYQWNVETIRRKGCSDKVMCRN